MNWGSIIKDSFAVGTLLGAVITIMIVASMLINKEMWLQDYPPDVKARWGSISAKAKRQHFVVAMLFFGVLITAVAVDVIRLEVVLGRSASFFEIFASIGMVMAVFNLVDAVIIDWLILLVLWPSLGVLPGTKGMAGYKDGRRWTINLLKGFALAPIAGALVAGVVFIFR